MRTAIDKPEAKGRCSLAFLMLGLALITSLQLGCRPSAVPRPASAAGGIPGRVTASGTQFLDGAGKPLLLHGINVVNKSKAEGYTGGIERADFAAIRSWGMNCVRLGILWDGLEPQPVKIDDQYLDRIALIVGWAKAEGLYVLLDMHQDLFSVKFSDGAPAWATLDEGKPHGDGGLERCLLRQRGGANRTRPFLGEQPRPGRRGATGPLRPRVAACGGAVPG
ncbi:MAG: cellulase family glycosylhydrolase [Verrucomicrobia bacterium]|nr:cellulase family glycosylhydrolase [Verrucomicrobiota bacterium]